MSTWFLKSKPELFSKKKSKNRKRHQNTLGQISLLRVDSVCTKTTLISGSVGVVEDCKWSHTCMLVTFLLSPFIVNFPRSFILLKIWIRSAKDIRRDVLIFQILGSTPSPPIPHVLRAVLLHTYTHLLLDAECICKRQILYVLKFFVCGRNTCGPATAKSRKYSFVFREKNDGI